MRLKINDYVLATEYSDRDSGDPWEVGILREIRIDINGTKYLVGGSGREWRHVYPITREQGEYILKMYGDWNWVCPMGKIKYKHIK